MPEFLMITAFDHASAGILAILLCRSRFDVATLSLSSTRRMETSSNRDEKAPGADAVAEIFQPHCAYIRMLLPPRHALNASQEGA